jgi:hypothetical protein
VALCRAEPADHDVRIRFQCVALAINGGRREAARHDYGKILQLIQLFNLPYLPSDVANAITQFPLFAKFGNVSNIMLSGDFINQMIDKVVNPFIVNLQNAGATSGSSLDTIQVDIQTQDALMTVQLGEISGGNVDDLLRRYLDVGTFNELFIEDRDAGAWGSAGPYLVYRPVPYVDAMNNYQAIQDIGTPSSFVSATSPLYPVANCETIRTDSVISLTATRNDDKVGNLFLVDAPRFTQNYTDQNVALWANMGAIFSENYENVNPQIYGIRKLEVQTEMGSPDETDSGNGSPNGKPRFDNQDSFVGWIQGRTTVLQAINKDNVVYENGEMRLRGNEKIKAGSYIQVDYGNGLQSLYYAHSVTHVFEPFGNFFTEVEYDRGTNFVDRLTASKSNTSPYLAEMMLTKDSMSNS